MCGIVGYYGQGNATEIAFKCLKNLEYRGYDSFGACLYTNNGLFFFKKVGKISQFHDESLLPFCNIAITHSRWATHGGISERNAHPHTDCRDDIAVVHNGIIENYEILKENLENLGHLFRSETDTEVVPHLIEEFCKKMSYDEAVFNTLRMLEGNSSFLILSKKNKGIYAARLGSPLVLGIASDGTFIASDVVAFLEHTNKIIYLNDGEIARIGEGLIFHDISGNELKKEVEVTELSAESAKLSGYDSFMIKEIYEQGNCMARASNICEKPLEDASEIIKNGSRIIFLACGTAYHAAMLGQIFFSEKTNRIPLCIIASEFGNSSKNINEKDCIIAISQSGETADLLNAVRVAKNKGAKIVSIVNIQSSTLCRESDVIIPINVGIEIAVASTKAFTGQVCALWLLSNLLAKEHELAKIKLKRLSSEMNAFLNSNLRDEIYLVAEKINLKNIFIIGRGYLYPIALEGALKIKEVSNILAEGYAGGELKHGPLALIEKGTPCIVLADGLTEKEILNNASEVKARGGEIIGISANNSAIFDEFIRLPENQETELFFITVVLQLLAYELGKLNGRDIDHCRNLAKSVTVK